MNRAASRRCCPSIRTVALLLHAIFILRPERQDHGVWCLNGWTSSVRLALSRIASGRNSHVVRTVPAVFPYLCFGKKSFYLSNTERRPNSIAMSSKQMHLNAGFFSNSEEQPCDLPLHSDECNLEQFKASRHWWAFGRKVLVVWTDDAWQMSVRTNARDLNFTVLNSAQSFLEVHN
jgi:hypothetical protein